MSSSIRVVAIVGSTTDPDQLFRSAIGDEALDHALASVTERDIQLELVSWLPSSGSERCISVGGTNRREPIADRFFSIIRGKQLHGVLQKVSVGRLINSLGPLDQSRVFWRAVQMNDAALSALASADVLIAVDLPAVRTAWKIRHRNESCDAYFGLSSALKVLATKSAV